MLALLYATYIIKGLKRYSEVPQMLKADVRQILVDMDMGHLAE